MFLSSTCHIGSSYACRDHQFLKVLFSIVICYRAHIDYVPLPEEVGSRARNLKSAAVYQTVGSRVY